ncbi:MAG: class I SAM-dependent methyltransferase [Deltaproteobacteria bacterium]|nr:class I SAM-dependent methyltransferase [Deltaproteobacteria bacterium]
MIEQGASREELIKTWVGKDRRIPQKFEPAYLTLRKIADFLQRAAETLPLTSHSRILDVGCREKPYFPFFASKTRNYFGVDIQIGPEVDAVFNGDALPFPDEMFDVVINTQVLEHTPDPHSLMDEMARVMKKGGWIIISAPFVWEIHNYPADYWRFSDQGIKELMKNFHRVTIEPCGNTAQCLLQTFNLFIDRTVSRLWFKRKLFKIVNTISEIWAVRSSDRLLPANYLVSGRK